MTLALDQESQQRFEELRQAHFPSELNRIPAHLTLFHTLPEQDETASILSRAAAERNRFAMHVAEVRSIGWGVACFLVSPEANYLHKQLSEDFAEHLSNQDRQGFRPHVVAQNKVTPQRAKETLALLQMQFQPWSCEAVGLDLWRYMNGPWLHLRRFDFSA